MGKLVVSNRQKGNVQLVKGNCRRFINTESKHFVLYATQMYAGYQLNKNPCSGEAFPEIFRRAVFLLFKNAVEVGDIIKPAVVGNFGNRLRGIDKHAGSMSQPYFRQAVDKGIAGTLFKKPAKGSVGHIGQPGHFI